jgi:hypothetical protein
MDKTEEAANALSDWTCETLTPGDINAMLAEAAAVDALFERLRCEPLHFASVVTAYFSPPGKDDKSDPAT